MIWLADEGGTGSAGSSDPDTELVSMTGVQGRSSNESAVWGGDVVSGKYDRVTVSRQQSLSTGNKSKKGAKDSVFKE
jgi:hypothetical protein